MAGASKTSFAAVAAIRRIRRGVGSSTLGCHSWASFESVQIRPQLGREHGGGLRARRQRVEDAQGDRGEQQF